MRDGSPPTDTRNEGFKQDQAASLGVILIGVLALAVTPGRYTFLSCLIGVTLLVALLAFGRTNNATNGQRVAVAIGAGLCAVLITGVVVQGIYQLIDRPPRLSARAVGSDYAAYSAHVLAYGERSAAWLGGIGAAIGVVAASLVSWLTVGRSEWRRLTPWPPSSALNQLVAWWSQPPASPSQPSRRAAEDGQSESRPRPTRASPASRRRRDSATGEPPARPEAGP